MLSFGVLTALLVLTTVGRHRTRVGHDVEYLLTGVSGVLGVALVLVTVLVALDVFE